MTNIYVNFDKSTGDVKPLNGVCCAPYAIGQGDNQQKLHDLFTQAHIPYCRLHDCCGGYGGTYFVDISNVFPDFDADENDPASYDFHYTDSYIGAIQRAGAESYYRLGETIEWGSKKYRVNPPADFAKWARICEHIIMHYNEGWANGFHYGLTYWEIWNEPENPGSPLGKCMWTGTKEQFFDLYRITSAHLKGRFPEIKIGGYGSCGFYPITRTDSPAEYQSFLTWFSDFLDMVKKERLPLDFFSWHIYTANAEELIAHGEYVRKTLDEKGFFETESHLNEWNYSDEGTGFSSKHTMVGGAFNAAVMCALQNRGGTDKAMYYCMSLQGRYNGLIDQNDDELSPSWYPFVAFGELYALGTAVETKVEGSGIYALGAKNDTKIAFLAANTGNDDEQVTLFLNGQRSDTQMKIYYITDEMHTEEVFSVTVPETAKLTLRIPKHTVVYIKGE